MKSSPETRQRALRAADEHFINECVGQTSTIRLMEDDIISSHSQHPFLLVSTAISPRCRRPSPPLVLMMLQEPLLNSTQATRQLLLTDMLIDFELLLVLNTNCRDSGWWKQTESEVCERHEWMKVYPSVLLHRVIFLNVIFFFPLLYSNCAESNS